MESVYYSMDSYYTLKNKRAARKRAIERQKRETKYGDDEIGRAAHGTQEIGGFGAWPSMMAYLIQKSAKRCSLFKIKMNHFSFSSQLWSYHLIQKKNFNTN